MRKFVFSILWAVRSLSQLLVTAQKQLSTVSKRGAGLRLASPTGHGLQNLVPEDLHGTQSLCFERQCVFTGVSEGRVWALPTVKCNMI